MNTKKLQKARKLKSKGWSLRDIASEIGMSHEGVRAALEKAPELLPAHMRPAKRPKRPASAKRAASGALLDVCRDLLSELRARAKSTQHPTLGTRYSADATNLAGLVLRLETQEAERADGLVVTMAEIEAASASLSRKLREHIERAGKLVCATCRVPLVVAWPEPAPVTPEPAPSAAPAPQPTRGADGMIAEARAALEWLLSSTAEAEAIGDEKATQRAGRAAVSIAGFVARLEKAIAKTRTDQFHISSAEIAKANGDISARLAANAARPLLCAPCSRGLSVRWGTGQ